MQEATQHNQPFNTSIRSAWPGSQIIWEEIRIQSFATFFLWAEPKSLVLYIA